MEPAWRESADSDPGYMSRKKRSLKGIIIFVKHAEVLSNVLYMFGI